MKKRTIALLLAMTLSASLFGCGSGSSAEPKQEEVNVQKEVQQEVVEQKTDTEAEKQEETESNSVIAENDVLVLKEKEGYGEYDFSVFEPQAWGEEKTFNTDAPVYNVEGIEVGYIKSGSTIKIDESLNLIWCCFTNPISGTEYDKLYVEQEYFSDDGSQDDVEVTQVETNSQDEILAKAGYDKDTTYSTDEYIEVLTKIFEEMGKEYNEQVEKDFIDYNKNKTTFDGYHVMMTYIECDFTDNEKVLENTKSVMNYVEYGLDGMSDITEFAISKGQFNGEETINIYVKVAH